MIMPAFKLRLRQIVVDVDTQTHFFRKDSSVCVRDHRRVLANVLRVVNWAQIRKVRRISTVQTFDGNGYRHLFDHGSRPEKIGRTVRGRCHSFEASDCTDLLPGILDEYEQLIFYKRCFDPFKEPRADRMLSELLADEFILIGAAAEGAVKATALGLLSRGKRVTILTDAVGSYSKFKGQIAFRVILERGGNLIQTRQLLSRPRPAPAILYDGRLYRAQF